MSTEAQVEDLAAIMKPYLFGRPDAEVGPATRIERDVTREQARAVLAAGYSKVGAP